MGIFINGSVTLEKSLAMSYKANIHLLYDPAILPCGFYPTEPKLKFTQKPENKCLWKVY